MTGIDRGASKSTEAVAKVLLGCLTDAARGRLAEGETVSGCLAADAREKIARTREKTLRTETRKCPELPDFGARDATLASDALAGALDLDGIFGVDLDAAAADETAGASLASCQNEAVQSMAVIAKAQLKEFNGCLKKGLRRGDIQGDVALLACYGSDPRGKVAKAVAATATRLAQDCNADEIASALPGSCAGTSPATLPDCIERLTLCSVCEALGTANLATGFCDLVDDGVANDSCVMPAAPEGDVARLWIERLLAVIRLDSPRPTVHARNLFHTSGAMYDAWAAYQSASDPYLAAESPTTATPEADRDAAISYAAYRILSHRFADSVPGPTAAAHFDYLMAVLGYDPAVTTTAGDSGAAVGNRIAAAWIAFGTGDGANEAGDYADTSGYEAANEPMLVTMAGTIMDDPNRWQPLSLGFFVTQGGTALPTKVQSFINAHWGEVTPFAIERPGPGLLYDDPGEPAELGGATDGDFKDAIAEVLEHAAALDADDGVLIDISPGARGNNTLGTDDGTGHTTNPATGEPYASQVVRRGDWARVIAEFWSFGPDAETPPGHWFRIANRIANRIADDPALEKRIGGAGPIVDDLEWNVKTYLALGGSVHDAAIATWEIARHYDTVRPLSAVRYMGGRGQSTDLGHSSYDPSGLPLVPGLIETITPATTAAGQRHAHLAGQEGRIAVRSWAGDGSGPPGAAGVEWIRAYDWLFYQGEDFVTPPFPAYVAAHSTIARAAAEVLAAVTADPFFPGGLGEFTASTDDFLEVEQGPSQDIVLQWATYFDAADEAGLSRLYGGVQVPADDLAGRVLGSSVGQQAWARAVAFFEGSAPP